MHVIAHAQNYNCHSGVCETKHAVKDHWSQELISNMISQHSSFPIKHEQKHNFFIHIEHHT